jgi:haemagglutination activity domain protein
LEFIFLRKLLEEVDKIARLAYLKDNGNLVNAASGLLLIPSVPFALAPFLQENFSNIEIYKDLKKQNKNIRNQISNKEIK